MSRKKNKKEKPDMEEVMAAVAGAVKNLAYFGCVHASLETACQETVGCALSSAFDLEEYLSGWGSSEQLVPRLEAAGVSVPPPPLFIRYPNVSSIAPGQLVFTNNVSVLTFLAGALVETSKSDL